MTAFSFIHIAKISSTSAGDEGARGTEQITLSFPRSKFGKPLIRAFITFQKAAWFWQRSLFCRQNIVSVKVCIKHRIKELYLS